MPLTGGYHDQQTITSVSNGRAGISPVFFATMRIYPISTTTGRIWYSAPTVPTDTTPDIGLGFSLATSPTVLTWNCRRDFKDAGFIELFPWRWWVGDQPALNSHIRQRDQIPTKNHWEGNSPNPPLIGQVGRPYTVT